MIVTNRTMEGIKKVLAGTKFVPLEQSGYQLVASGLVSFEEIESAVGK